MNWKSSQLSEFLNERKSRIPHQEANKLGLKRIKKIDFSGNIHLDEDTKTRTSMIRIKDGDLVISGINAAKGAIAVYHGDEDVLATIHYSAYSFDEDKISVEFLQWFFRSEEFSDLLKEQVPGGIKTELKPKHILPLKVKIPELSDQVAISTKLNRIHFEQIQLDWEISHQQSLLTKLKQAILQEAIQGKLTADWRAANPDAEPASKLLDRIKAEKAQLIAEKKIRKEKALPKISDEEIPFDIPEGWVWCRLRDIGIWYGGGTPTKDTEKYWNGGIPWITPKDMKKPFIKDSQMTITETGVKESSAKIIPADSVLFVVRGMILIHTFPVAVNVVQATVNQDMKALIPAVDGIASFLRLALDASSSRILSLVDKSTHGTRKLKTDSYEPFLIPIPPLAEQKIIEERVKSVMAIRRSLEDEIEHSRETAESLLQAVLKEAFATAS